MPRHYHRGELKPASAASLALVFSAGGARGFAHIGALSVIEQHCLPIDLVVGVSMGSVIGAGYAAGIRVDEMLAFARTVSVRRLFRPRPARLGLIDPAGVRDVLRRVLGDRRFADLDRELVVLSASLTTGEPVVIRDGLVADAVLASTAIPLVFPPVSRGEHHLVDGGLIDGLRWVSPATSAPSASSPSTPTTTPVGSSARR
ncbi:MAG: patatin-like phospholipase family protein [Chloroflexota bacterium]|nr:patatin-like phospholipase family protein [Chloroflexota bacterium]